MKVIEYPNLNEKLYYKKLSNGLEVYLHPRQSYNKVYATFATKYGSIDNRFVPIGQEDYVTVPLGIAHFLEHKLFETKEGPDAIAQLSNLGAQANAYTSYSKTAYLFSATNNVNEALNILLDFVQDPYFTEENVLKEQGIIDQELKMYLDVPSERLRLGLLQNMFKTHYIREDIGGTVESIKQIKPEDLYTVYNTFYHPSNMIFFVTGNFNSEEVINIIETNQNNKEFPELKHIKREYLCEDNIVFRKEGSHKMDILTPKVAVGVKLPYQKYKTEELMKLELILKIILENSFGSSSTNYQEMLDLELINNTFSFSTFVEETAGFITISTDTFKVDEFVTYVKKRLLELKKIKVSKESFERYKKVILGNFIKSLNYLEFIANAFIHYNFMNEDLFKMLDIIDNLTLKDIKQASQYFTEEAISVYTIYPKHDL